MFRFEMNPESDTGSTLLKIGYLWEHEGLIVNIIRTELYSSIKIRYLNLNAFHDNIQFI